MIKRIDFVNELATRLEIKRTYLIEKDFILHLFLLHLSKDKFFSSNFIFKGGTCLIKCYFGYTRFSEDIDFTWRNQNDFTGKSQKTIRATLSNLIYKTGSILEKIANELTFEFKIDKSNRRFLEIGGSNKSCTFKIWYKSDVLKRESFVKVQINFVETLCFQFREQNARSLLSKRDRDLDLLFPEFGEYSQQIKISAYDIKEILAEKVRAILTRRGTKARDFLDIYLIHETYGLDPVDIEACISRKIRFALDLYERFRFNLEEKIRLLDSDNFFNWGGEQMFLIKKIDEGALYSYLTELQQFLRKIALTFQKGR